MLAILSGGRRIPSRSPSSSRDLGELNDRPTISMFYRIDRSQDRGPHFIEPCKWNSLVVEIGLSRNENGRDTFFVDDMNVPAALLDGLNMHKDLPHFLKLGMYRHRKSRPAIRLASKF